MNATGIEYCDVTWNIVRGCREVGEGCRRCWARRLARRFGGAGQPYAGLTRSTSGGVRWTGDVVLVAGKLPEPLRARRARVVFVCSTSDLFQAAVPDSYIGRALDVMAEARHHTFMVLTKHPLRMRDLLTAWAGSRRWPLENAIIGVSVENQRALDERVPALLETPALARWLSVEPLLGDLNLLPALQCGGIDYVAVGGESGPGARAPGIEWVRRIRDACHATDTPWMFKQWGGPGARARDRLLDGQEYLARPRAGGGEILW